VSSRFHGQDFLSQSQNNRLGSGNKSQRWLRFVRSYCFDINPDALNCHNFWYRVANPTVAHLSSVHKVCLGMMWPNARIVGIKRRHPRGRTARSRLQSGAALLDVAVYYLGDAETLGNLVKAAKLVKIFF
jgi:hypothetical protein